MPRSLTLKCCVLLVPLPARIAASNDLAFCLSFPINSFPSWCLQQRPHKFFGLWCHGCCWAILRPSYFLIPLSVHTVDSKMSHYWGMEPGSETYKVLAQCGLERRNACCLHSSEHCCQQSTSKSIILMNPYPACRIGLAGCPPAFIEKETEAQNVYMIRRIKCRWGQSLAPGPAFFLPPCTASLVLWEKQVEFGIQ